MGSPLFAAASLAGRWIPSGAGDIRVANLAYRRTRLPRAGVRRLRGGARIYLDPTDWPQAQAWVLGRYDIATVRFVTDRLPARGGTFLDVGAHIGLVSFQVAARRPGVTIHAFEPHPVAAAAFRRNARLNDARAVLVEGAASDHEGRLAFDLGSHAVGDGAATVPTLRLDRYIAERSIAAVDVMKLDVEGHELEALRGASEALEHGVIRAVTLEAVAAHGADLDGPDELLRSAGFARCRMPDTRPGWVRSLRPVRRSANVAYAAVHR